ncbi:MAG: PilZ domain-containing protein [Mesorhizobium sp.]|nr:PilZ domain-containing protein [Mesorhizobium sp.]MBL8575921.1 PilZ domain-containing protein [Mesorhizobium sp.]
MPGPTDSPPPREYRRRVLKGAAIISGINDSIVQCTIRNMHEHGAELVVHVEARVPKSFLLFVPIDGIGYRAELRWRKRDRCGVSFHGTEPKPHWYYG